MTVPETTFLDELKSTVTVRLLDPLGKSIEGLKYQIREGEKIVAKGVTDAQGNISSFASKIGTELTVHVERFASGEMKQVRTLIPWTNDFKVKLLSGKVKQTVAMKKDEGSPGAYKRKTYKVRKNDTLGSIAPQFHTTPAALAQLNGIKVTDTIFVDQVLKVPPQPGSAAPPAPSATPATPPSAAPASVAPSPIPAAAGPAAPAPVAVSLPPAPVANESVPPAPAPSLAPPGGGQAPEPTASAGQENATSPSAMEPKTLAGSAPNVDEKSSVPPATAPAPKVIPIQAPVPTTVEEDRGENGTPKATVKLACEVGTCIQEGQSSDLIEEINIRLAGFGGTIVNGEPWTKFTAKTTAAVKQFQRDYMQVTPTGKVCGAVLRAMDEFTVNYPFDLEKLRCKCHTQTQNHCGGFGRNYTSSQAVNHPLQGGGWKPGTEFPGIHRALLNAFRAALFYLKKEYPVRKYKFLRFSSGYRCWLDNSQQYPDHAKKWTVNHMGNALDMQFTYNNGASRCAMPHTDTIRNSIFREYIGARGLQTRNRFGLETAAQSATSWVHMDCTAFDAEFKKNKYYSKTQGHADGTPIVTMAKSASMLALLNCGGIPGPSTLPQTAAPAAPLAGGPTAAPGSPLPPVQPAPTTPAKKKPATSPVPKAAGKGTVVPISGTRKSVASLTISPHGIAFLHGFEQCKLLPYNDNKKKKGKTYCTIGWGHLIDGLKSCEQLESANSKKYLEVKNGITDAQADKIFEKDLSNTIDGIVKVAVQVPLYQHEFDALVSLAFNAGGKFFGFEKLLGKLNKANYAGCCAEFADITNKGVPGLVTRRKREMDMFTNSVYDSEH